MRTTFAIVVAGALGVLARYLAQNAIGVHGRFPWATFVVNESGAFAAGFLFTLIGRRFSVPDVGPNRLSSSDSSAATPRSRRCLSTCTR